MPVCRECGLTAATVEMRRTSTGAHLCKEKLGCRIRKADRRLMADIQKAS